MSVRVRHRLMTSSLCFGAAAFVAVPAIAQQADPAPAASSGGSAGTQEQDVTQTIVVTGSRIARPDLQTSVPVAVVSAQRIQQNGAANIQDVLTELPQVGQNISRSSSNFLAVQNGIATVNLRNLDSRQTNSYRTLVLIDGRRAAGVAGTSAVDLNNIPTDLIDRVEVITGGASAVYGSEAVAGVVNFVLKDEFEGVRVRGQSTVSSKGDAPREFGSITAGTSLFGGRGHIVGNLSYDLDHGLASRDRTFSAHDNPARSSYAVQGLFDVAPAGAAQYAVGTGNTFTFNTANALKPYESANIDGYDRDQVRLLALPVERVQATLLGSYEFSDAAQLYAQGSYAHASSRAGIEASVIGSNGAGGALNFDGSRYAGIPITSPYVPAAIRAQAAANGVNFVQFHRRAADIYNASNTNRRDYYRGVLGLKGDIAPHWSYDVYYEHSQSRDHTFRGGLYAPNLGAALNNEVGPDGQVRCSSAAARAAGCVPLNIFGYNTATPAAAAFLTTYTGPTTTATLIDGSIVQFTNAQSTNFDYLARVHQDVASGSVHGDLFSLWGGPVGLAVGAEYRREKSSEVYDPFTQTGRSSSNQISNTIGRFDVTEGFAEIVAPIVEDRPLVHYLGVEGAARYSDYSTIGGVWSWKVGGSYAPSPDLRLRAIYARATRAPNISELFASQHQSFPFISDPCDQARARGDGAPLGTLPAACASIPGIAATVAARGQFAYSTAQLQSIDSLLGGNPALKEETADTLTVGAVLTPRFVRNLSLTVDYYHIRVKNAIGIVSQQTSVSQCFATGNPTLCGNVTRDANGFITRVNALNLNTASILAAGFDVEGRYSLPLGQARLDLDVAWNHRTRQEQTPFAGAPVQNELGEADCNACGRLGSGFRNKVNASATAGWRNFQLNYRADYLGPLRDNLDGSTATVTRIPAYWYHNVQAKFLVGEGRRMELYFGINNLFDKKPPIFSDLNPVTFPGTQTVADTYDLYGRMLYAGATFSF